MNRNVIPQQRRTTQGNTAAAASKPAASASSPRKTPAAQPAPNSSAAKVPESANPASLRPDRIGTTEERRHRKLGTLRYMVPPRTVSGSFEMCGLILVGLMFGLSGCTMAPKYSRPAAPVPSAWPAGPAYTVQALSNNVGLPDWRQFTPTQNSRRSSVSH